VLRGLVLRTVGLDAEAEPFMQNEKVERLARGQRRRLNADVERGYAPLKVLPDQRVELPLRSHEFRRVREYHKNNQEDCLHIVGRF
jgi:hypothetical protein